VVDLFNLKNTSDILSLMNRVLITIFVILLVPAFGLPVEFDRWIYGLLVLILAYFLYTLLNTIKNKEVIENPTKITRIPKGKTKSKKTAKKEEVKETTTLISKEEKESIKKAVKESK